MLEYCVLSESLPQKTPQKNWDPQKPWNQQQVLNAYKLDEQLWNLLLRVAETGCTKVSKKTKINMRLSSHNCAVNRTRTSIPCFMRHTCMCCELLDVYAVNSPNIYLFPTTHGIDKTYRCVAVDPKMEPTCILVGLFSFQFLRGCVQLTERGQ